MAWLRLYDSVLDDPKVQRLSDRLFRAWINLLCLAKRHGGEIPKDHDSIAFSLRLTVSRAIETIKALIAAHLMDETETGYVPHDWNTHQYQSDVSSNRVKQFRERQRNVSSAVSETPPETETEQIQKEEVVDARPLLGRICEIFRIRLEDDPSRITWLRQTEEMLRDGIPEADIIAGAEVARTNAVLKLSYVRAAAMKLRNTKEIPNGRPRRESPERQAQRIASELIAEFQASDAARDTDPHDGSGLVVLHEGFERRPAEGSAAPDVRRLIGKV